MFNGVCLFYTEVALYWQGQLYPSNSLFNLTEIGGDIISSLWCVTNKQDCCVGENRAGDWFYPNSTRIQDTSSDFSVTRGSSVVRLMRQGEQVATGIYACMIANSNGVIETLYAGLYPVNQGERNVLKLAMW